MPEADTIETPKRKPTTKAKAAMLTDAEFIETAYQHRLIFSDDHTVKAARNRLMPLLRILYATEIAKELAEYHKAYDAAYDAE